MMLVYAVTDSIHRVHIPCPNCGFCNHLYTGESVPEKLPDETTDCKDVDVFQLTPFDVEPLSNVDLSCAACNSIISIVVLISTILEVSIRDDQQEQNAPTTGILQ